MSIEPTISVIALAADMIFASKIRGAAATAGVTVNMARNPAQLIEQSTATGPGIILLDLDTRGLAIGDTVRALRAAVPEARIIAFVSHTRTDAILEARDAGAQVLARSAFVTQLPSLLSG